AFRAGGYLPVAARCGRPGRRLRRGDPGPGQDDPRPRPGHPRVEEVPGHEQARAGRSRARRPVRDLLLHRPGGRGPVPGHAAARGVLRGSPGAGAEGGRGRTRPSLARRRARITVSEGGVLPGAGLRTWQPRGAPAHPTRTDLMEQAMIRRSVLLSVLFAMAGVAAAQSPVDLSVLDADLGGPRTRVLVLGSVHLSQLPEGVDATPEALQ